MKSVWCSGRKSLFACAARVSPCRASPRADRRLALVELVAGAAGVALGADERREALDLVVLEHLEPGRGSSHRTLRSTIASAVRRRRSGSRNAHQEQDRRDHDHVDQGRPEVRLEEHDRRRQRRDAGQEGA